MLWKEKQNRPARPLEAPGLLMVQGGGRHDHRLALSFSSVRLTAGSTTSALNVDEHLQRQRLGLRRHRAALGAVVAEPHLGHARRPIAHARAADWSSS